MAAYQEVLNVTLRYFFRPAWRSIIRLTMRVCDQAKDCLSCVIGSSCAPAALLNTGALLQTRRWAMSRRQGESRVARVRERCLHDAAGGGLTCRFEPVSHLDEAIAFHEGSQGLRSSGLGVKLYGEAVRRRTLTTAAVTGDELQTIRTALESRSAA
jgi:hypothetical protein